MHYDIYYGYKICFLKHNINTCLCLKYNSPTPGILCLLEVSDLLLSIFVILF